MNTNEQTQAVVEYVRVNSRQPIILTTLVDGSDGKLTVEEGSKVFFNKDYTHTLQDGTVIQINRIVIDIEEGSGDYILVMGGDVTDHIVDGNTRDSFAAIDVIHSVQLLEVLENETALLNHLGNTSLFINHDRDRRPIERVLNLGDRERETIDPIQELLCSHLDDIITQATILKTTDQQAVKNDAYARLHFSMSRLDRIESAQYRSRERPQRTRMVDGATERRNSQRPDIIYRESTDSFYTPSGEFIETREQRDKRLWGTNNRRGQFWEHD